MKHSLPLNQEWIDEEALKIVKKLQSHNHTTYLVGGCVRDLLIGLPPKDFDIATSATPTEVNKIIRPSHIIGRRFQLVLVKRYGEQYEISTFRAQSTQDSEESEGPITNDNTFGTAEEDARRRDFTVNSFFYDPVNSELIDYCNGLRDIENRTIRMIGEPRQRIQEDPLRMLRALRFAHKSQFSIEPELRQALFDLAEQIRLSVLPRRREELLKVLRLPSAIPLLWESHDLNLLKHWSPTLDHVLKDGDQDTFVRTLQAGLEYVSDPNNAHELFSVLLFALLSAQIKDFDGHLNVKPKQLESLSITMKDEWGMFRGEQDQFLNTLSFIKQLQQIKDLRKIRERYKLHLLKSNSMSPALTLSKAYGLLPESSLHFWLSEFWRVNESLAKTGPKEYT